jgi:PAS domain S-box-containing protein
MILVVVAASVATTEQQIAQINAQEQISSNIERGANNLNSISVNYFLYQEDQQLSQWNSTLSSISSDLSNLKSNTPQQQMLEQNVTVDLQSLNAFFDDVVSYLQSAPRNVSVRIDPAFQTKWGSMTAQSQTLASDSSSLSSSLNDQARQVNGTNVLLIISLVGTFGAFVATIYLMFFRRTLKSVAKLQDGINTVSSGNLEYVTETKRNDEISELSFSFNQMTANLKTVTAYSRSLIEASLDPLVTINAKGKITDVNKSTEEVTGYTREELIGSDFSDYFTEPEKARVGYKKVFTQGYVRDYPLAIRHKSGKVTDVLYNASVYRNQAGEIQGVFAAARDVTERKLAEQKLSAASLYSRSLLEASLDPLVTISKEGKITDVNEATENVTGCSREELIGSDFSEYFTEAEKARAGYKQVFTEGFVRDYPLAIRNKSGKITDVLYNAAVYKNVDGTISGVFAAARDVTSRKQAEEKLRAASQYSRSLIEASLDPLVTISAEGKITDVNKSTEEVTGFSREQLIGSDFSDYFTEPQKARKGYQEVFTEGFVRDYPLAIRQKTGKIIDVLYNATLFRNEAGQIQGIFAAARDVTERNAMENEIKQTLEKLKQSNSELEQFAYVASHDLQEPLRMVASYVQLLERRYKGKLDADADGFIAYAVDGANRMRGLIDDLLTYSRVSRLGKPFEPTDLESTLDIVLMNLQASIAENSAVVTHNKLPVVMADGGQLVQLFQNLISNAIKFHGKKPPHVHVSAQVKETEYLFSVRDNGIGIAPEYFDRLFKIFQRLHTREEYPGSGIGLAVCKRIVERHGGRIWLESQVGKGSTIYFTLNKQKGSD